VKFMPSLCAVVLLLGGCGSVPKDRFYVLGGVAENAKPATAASYTLAINPVNVPDMVDRPQFVLYQGPSRVEIMEHERWAEPLKSAIPNAVARELRTQLPEARVAVYPDLAVTEAPCRISLDVQRMEARLGESALVEALWSLRCADGRLKQGRSFVKETTQDGSYEALSSAFGRAFAQIAGEMAQAVRSLPPPPPPATK
jgi:uncharacterized protein